jgi:hypothetical protein
MTHLTPNEAGKPGTQLNIFDAMIAMFGFLKFLTPRGFKNSQTDVNVNPKRNQS